MHEHTPFSSIDEYIAMFPDDVQTRLQQLRATIKAAAPDATEAIKYQMPTFVLHGNVIHFAAHKAHIGLYPTPSGIDAFAAELAPYMAGKGTLQFPLDQPLPLDLITNIVEFRVAENTAKHQAKARKRQKG